MKRRKKKQSVHRTRMNMLKRQTLLLSIVAYLVILVLLVLVIALII